MSDNLTTSVTFAMTINLGNYNSVKLGVTVEDHMTSIDEFDDTFKSLYTRASGKVLGHLKQLKEKHSE